MIKIIFLFLFLGGLCKGGIAASLDDIDEFLARIASVEKQIQENIFHHREDMTRTIILGNTGSGKSSLVHALAGKPMNVRALSFGPFIEVDPENQIPGFVIARGLASGTQIPVSWIDDTINIAYWDCPGFMDPSGVSQDIITLFAIEGLFTAPCNVKMLLTIEQKESAYRGQSIIKRLKNLRNFFQNEEQLHQAVSIIVTKQRAWGDTLPDPKSLFEEIGLIREEQGRIVPTICDTEEARRIQIEGISPEELVWASSFLAYLGNNDRIFAFPEPRFSGEYSYDWFPDRDKILSNLSTSAVINPEVNILTSFLADTRICLLMEQAANQLDRAISQVGRLFRVIKSSTNNNAGRLAKAQKVVRELNELSSDLIGTPAKLAEQLRLRSKKFDLSAEESREYFLVVDKLISSEKYLRLLDKLDRGKRSEAWQSGVPNIPETLKKLSEESLDGFQHKLNKMEDSCCIVS